MKTSCLVLFLASTACGPAPSPPTATPSAVAPVPAAPTSTVAPVSTASSAACPASCPAGQTCLTWTNEGGGLDAGCEIECGPKRSCPAGLGCVDYDDGPQAVCRAK